MWPDVVSGQVFLQRCKVQTFLVLDWLYDLGAVGVVITNLITIKTRNKKMMKSKNKKTQRNTVGHYGFVLGILLSFALGFYGFAITAQLKVALTAALVLCGISVAIQNITEEEAKKFMFYTVTLIIAVGLGATQSVLTALGTIGIIPIGAFVSSVLIYLMIFLVSAAITVGFRQIYELARTK